MTTTTLDGTTTPLPIPAGTTVQVNDGDQLLAVGTIDILGEVFLNGPGGPFNAAPTSLAQVSLLLLASPTVTLTGGGTVLLGGTDPANIFGNSATLQTLVNAGDTIAGTGGIGGAILAIDASNTLYPLTLVNAAGGVIDATGTVGSSFTPPSTYVFGQGLYISNGSSVLVNAGLMEATGAGGLFITASTIDQSGGGTLLANGAGVAISLRGPTSSLDIIGGTLDTANGGSLAFAQYGYLTLDGSGSSLTIGTGSNVQVTVTDASVNLLGTIVNQGTLGGGSPLILYTPTVAMTGGGTLQSPYIFGHGGSLATFVNADTITGSGEIGVSNFIYTAPVLDHGIQQTGSAPVALTNLAGGVIDAAGTLNSGANDAGRGGIAGILLYNAGATSINYGLLEATGIQGLDINGGTLDQSGGGTLLASGTAVGVYLQSVDVIGGQVVANNGGSIDFNGGANTLTSTGAPIAINAGGVLEVRTSAGYATPVANLTIVGSAIANAGTLIDASTLILASPTTTLYGGGTVLIPGFLGGSPGYGVLTSTGTTVLINNDNTITNNNTLDTSGDIAGASFMVTNAARGVISNLSLDVGTLANAGLLENVSVGVTTATTIVNSGTGELLASGAGVIAGLYNADIVGGTLAASGGGLFQLIASSHMQPGTTLDGRGAPVTIAAGAIIQDLATTVNDSGLTLLGTIDLLGTIQGDLNIHSGPFAIPNAGVLTGTGTLDGYLSNTGVVLAQTGTLTVTNDVAGSGSIAIDPGAAFVLGGASGETVNFGGGTNERLILGSPSAFTGTLASLGIGDAIDLAANNVTSAIVTGNTLQVTSSNAATVNYALAGLPSGATFAPVSPPSLPDIFNFSYTGAAGAAYPGVTAVGTGSFAVTTAPGGALSLANVVSFGLTLTVTSTGANPGTDVITYMLGDLTGFAATLGGGAFTSLSLGTDSGSYNHSVPVVGYETFQIASLGNGGAASDVLNSTTQVTQGSVAVTPQGALLSELVVQCFAEGTSIATPDGERAVETLTRGDTVLLASGDIQDIVWIGHRHVDARHHPDPARVQPVRIAAGAFGPGLPRSDLLLSPDHAVYVHGVLIPIKCLINHTTIARMPIDTIVYYHIELPSHDVLLAEGMPAESWLDTGDRACFDNYGRIAGPHRAMPGHNRVACIWEAMGYAPLIVAGPRLHAVRQIVEDRAASIRHGQPAEALV